MRFMCLRSEDGGFDELSILELSYFTSCPYVLHSNYSNGHLEDILIYPSLDSAMMNMAFDAGRQTHQNFLCSGQIYI